MTIAKSAVKRTQPASVAVVTGILEGYAAKAVFRGFQLSSRDQRPRDLSHDLAP